MQLTLKWKLFGLANYIMLIAYLYLITLSMRFIIEEVPHEQSLAPLMPVFISQIVIIINLAFNIYAFHIHLPHKPLSHKKKRYYLILFLLNAISFSIITIYSFIEIYDELKSQSFGNFAYFILSVFSLHFLLGLFILVCQFDLRKFIKTN
jgi:hypothetical protein